MENVMNYSAQEKKPSPFAFKVRAFLGLCLVLRVKVGENLGLWIACFACA